MVIAAPKYCFYCMTYLESEDAVCPFCRRSNRNVANWPNNLPRTVLKNRYVTGERVEGGFGESSQTYIGRDLPQNKLVMVKEFQPVLGVRRVGTMLLEDKKQTFEDFELVRRQVFRKAYLKMRMRGIRGIVPFDDVFYENGTVYIVRDFVNGQPLTSLMKKRGGRLDIHTVAALFVPLMDALTELHEKFRGVHGAVSPGNVIITNDGWALLTDCDVFPFFNTNGPMDSRLLIHPSEFCAPEQQRNINDKLDGCSDVFSLCATMYYALTGETAYKNMYDRPDKLLHYEKEAHCTGLCYMSVDELGNIIGSKWAASVLLTGMSQERSERWSDMRELKRAFCRTAC